MVIEQRADVGADVGVRGLRGEPGRPLGRIAIERRLEQIADACLLFGRHRGDGLSSRKSHARASDQRRLSVAGRHAERVGRFVDAVAGEVAQLDDARLLRIQALEPLERFVERGQHRVLHRRADERFAERHAIERRPSLLRAARARALHQNLAHRSRGDADEMPLVVPRRAGARQAQVHLVDQRRRLQRLPRPLAPHVGAGETPQLVIHARREFVGVGCAGAGPAVRGPYWLC